MKWEEWDDEYGRCLISSPYTIREMRRVNGVSTYELRGGGLQIQDTDVDFLKREAEEHKRAARARTGLSLVEPGPSREPAAPALPRAYTSELRELTRAARELTGMATGSKIYRDAEILGSKDQLVRVRDQLQQIIEKLP
jgi:hypothetical protein